MQKSIYFKVVSPGKVAISEILLPEDDAPLQINEVGNFMKMLRLKNNLSKKEVARLLNFKNINKTIKNIGKIEENSECFPEYIEKLVLLYKSSMEDFYRAKERGKSLKNQIEKEQEEKRKIRVQQERNFYVKLIQKLPLLFVHFEEIMNTPEYYFLPLIGASVSSAWIGRARTNLYLGEVLTLWKNQSWVGTCNQCQGKVYVTRIGGSVLSGCGYGRGFCVNCMGMEEVQERFRPFFFPLIKLPIRELPEDLDFITIDTLIERLERNSRNK